MKFDKKFWISVSIKLFSAILVEILFSWLFWQPINDVSEETDANINVMDNIASFIDDQGHTEL